jgi:hypothetical protein
MVEMPPGSLQEVLRVAAFREGCELIFVIVFFVGGESAALPVGGVEIDPIENAMWHVMAITEGSFGV